MHLSWRQIVCRNHKDTITGCIGRVNYFQESAGARLPEGDVAASTATELFQRLAENIAHFFLVNIMPGDVRQIRVRIDMKSKFHQELL